MELPWIERREAYVRGRSAAGGRSGRWRVSNMIHIRPVDEGFTYDGILKLRTHFVDPEVATEIHILGAFSGDELIGTIVYDWMKVYDDRPDKELYVLDAYLLPSWRRRRVFTRLFHAMTQHHQGCRVGGHFVEPHLERMANRYNQTIGGVLTITCLNGTYGVQFGKLRTRQFAGSKGRKEAQKIKAAVLRGELAELTETVK